MERFEAPVPAALVQELVAFWPQIPELTMAASWPDELRGTAPTPHRSLIYVVRRGGQVVAMCQFWISRRLPRLAEFCYPATLPALRGQGIGTTLWQAAVDDAFQNEGVQAIFLGTTHREAFRTYRRVGFARLPASTTFFQASGGLSPEEFLADWFRAAGPAQVFPGGPDDRLPSYPLLVLPHDWQILDANGDLFSTRYALHRTFHGLFGKYERVAADGQGAYFAARGADSRVVGLASARLDGEGRCMVDAFTHHRYLALWPELIEAASGFGHTRGAGLLQARVSREDFAKRALFEQMGFRVTGPAPAFVLDGLQLNRQRDIEPVTVPALRMERTP